ncbi:ATP-binding protein, partial [Methylobacterium radiotolerans]|uniref:ATP-binding protein n=1 Tax=Methylobacterium radiotolerans TaxID=31998 RepID=UPI0027963A06
MCLFFCLSIRRRQTSSCGGTGCQSWSLPFSGVLARRDRRTPTNGTAGERGSGLVLLLSRDLVERQGGVMTVTSAIDRGTTFRFRLPAPVVSGPIPSVAA